MEFYRVTLARLVGNKPKSKAPSVKRRCKGEEMSRKPACAAARRPRFSPR